MNFSSTPIFHLPRFFSLDIFSTMSPGFTERDVVLWFRLCFSLNPLTYSLVHLDHNTSLQRRRYFALFLKSLFSINSHSSSGKRFGCPYCTSLNWESEQATGCHRLRTTKDDCLVLFQHHVQSNLY